MAMLPLEPLAGPAVSWLPSQTAPRTVTVIGASTRWAARPCQMLAGIVQVVAVV